MVADIPVKVCLRCRPLVSKEISDGCQICLKFTSNKAQVILGTDKAFTYDNTYSPTSSQQEVYRKSVSPLIKALFEGYNVTVLAYGQTGSGKTYTMGTSHSTMNDPDAVGVIPRAMTEVYSEINKRSSGYDYIVKASFLEIYKEEVHDLLRATAERRKDAVTIRDDVNGDLKIAGLIEDLVTSPDDVLSILKKGSLARTTGSTAMNAHSSRSHAIFTLSIMSQSKADPNESTCAKFHLVDLAGSEKADKTQAHGERFREGININKGLLALGNVINALCDKLGHIPYRDSKLTRLLQDSLGGNSHTLMIACVSPADFNFEESLNTLRYADRARKIKNKPVVNHDPQSLEILRLKQMIEQMKSGPYQNWSCPPSQGMHSLLEQNKSLENENHRLVTELQSAVNQNSNMCEKLIVAEMTRDKLKQSLKELNMQTNTTISEFSKSVDCGGDEKIKMIEAIQNKVNKIQEDQSKDQLQMLKCSETIEENGGELSPESKSFRVEHTLRQAEMQKQLQALNDALDKKEVLAAKMTQNDGQLETMKIHYEIALNEMESEVKCLQKEKEELSNNLRNVNGNVGSSKISEQRRQRLMELEAKINDLRKKIVEQGRMLKMKDQVEKKVSVLSQDIHSMKQQRVKLMKQMKEDAQHFQKWRTSKEQEVSKLKQQDRKRQFEMMKMEKIHSKQQNVLKRKIEHAMSHNKRLKDAVDKQKVAREERNKKPSVGHEGVKSRTEQWLRQEIEISVVKKESRHHLNILLEDRKALSQQLDSLKNESSIQPVQTEIAIRSAQIAELQQKLSDIDQDESTKKRWDNLNSMVESKCALKWLFNNLVQSKYELFEINQKYNDMQLNCEETMKNSEYLSLEMEKISRQHENAIVILEREHEEKVLYLLQQLPSNINSAAICDNTLIERIKFQNNEISRLGSLYEEYNKVVDDNEKMKKALSVSKVKRSNKLMPNLSHSTSDTSLTKKRKYDTAYAIPESDGESDPENTTHDPDWMPYMETNVKPSSMGCKCKSVCKGCVCVKTNKFCSSSCRCNAKVCTNLHKEIDPLNKSDLDRSSTIGSNSSNSSLENPRKILKTLSGSELNKLPEKKMRRTISKSKKSASQSSLTKRDESDGVNNSGILKLGSTFSSKKKNQTFFGAL